MKQFSLSTLFLWIALCAVAALTLKQPSLVSAGIVVSLTVASLVLLAIIGVCRRSLRTIGIVIACVAYLFIADGGVFPNAERFLPTEWLLAKRTQIETDIVSGWKPSKSLSLWLFRTLTQPNGHQHVKDFGAPRTKHPSGSGHVGETVGETTDDILNELLELVDNPSNEANDGILGQPVGAATVPLPTIKFVSVNTIITCSDRDSRPNRPYFVVGHCLFVLLFAMAMFQIFHKPSSTNAPDPTNPA